MDDHPVVREGVAVCLGHEQDLAVCALASNANEALRAIHQHDPDAVVLDLNLPDGHGLDLIKDIRTKHKRLAILVFTMLDESVFALRALRAGAQGYVMKHESPQRVITALRTIFRGDGPVVSQAVLGHYLQEFLTPAKHEPSSPVEGLSDTDLEVFEFLGRGLSTREIASKLNRSVKTVETHYARVKQKLHLTGHSNMICHAVRWVETGH